MVGQREKVHHGTVCIMAGSGGALSGGHHSSIAEWKDGGDVAGDISRICLPSSQNMRTSYRITVVPAKKAASSGRSSLFFAAV